MSTLPSPTVARHGSNDPAAPIVVLLHGRGSHELDIIGLARQLPVGPAYVAVRAPIAEGGGFAWFANRGIGRPVAESLADTMAWFRTWLDAEAPVDAPDRRRVVLVGFSGGAAFAGGLLLDDPERFDGAAIIAGTMPFDAGVPTTPGRLAGCSVFVAQGDLDAVIPRELLDRTWDYLTGDAGSVTTALRDQVGHAISPAIADGLSTWLSDLLA